MAYKYTKERKEYIHRHYLRNKDKYIAKRKRRRDEIRIYLRKIKVEGSCVTCGEDDWRCLDFHHETGKTILVSRISNRGWGQKRIDEELANCQLICANCHRKTFVGP